MAVLHYSQDKRREKGPELEAIVKGFKHVSLELRKNTPYFVPELGFFNCCGCFLGGAVPVVFSSYLFRQLRSAAIMLALTWQAVD